MASSGVTAWNKYFKGNGNVSTVMKKDSATYDNTGKLVGRIEAGEPVLALEQPVYASRYPVRIIKNGTVVYVTFDNIQKPKTKTTASVKLKPQDFKCIKAKQLWIADDLTDALINEIEERTDLEPSLKTYLVAITNYYGKKEDVSSRDVDDLYDISMPGKAELQKDYGEMLGAIACIHRGILDSSGIKVSTRDKIDFPIRGNEPIVDYYIKPATGPAISISAKSGETTNTLKPADVITLLDKAGKTNLWKNTAPYKIMQMVASYSTLQFPFYAINQLFSGTLDSKALSEVTDKFKSASMSTKNYNEILFVNLFNRLGLSITDKPTIGALFYATEKYVIQELNRKYKDQTGKIFEDATSGLVTYVKFKVDAANRHGKFEVLASNAATVKKKDIMWRSKNSKNRAADKIGLQP